MEETSATPRWRLILLQLIFAYLVGLKLWFDIAVTPMGDEAYYWMWGQHLSWSYFDHPPLDGWLQGLVALVFGWSNFSARLLTWLSLGGTLWIFWLWSARLAPADRQGWFWHTAVIYSVMPVIFLMSSFAFHDHLLLFFLIASAYFFHGFAGDVEDGRPGWRNLYIAAALLGLAVLTKYNGVFLGLGYAAWILVRPGLRPLLLKPQLWLAALLAIAIQAPVIWWNLTENMASFRFHLVERPTADWSDPHPLRAVIFFASILVSISPVMGLGLFRIPWLRPASLDTKRVLSLSTTTFLLSTVIWTAIALWIEVYFHWNIVAYAALAPIGLLLVGRRIGLILHVAFGLLIATIAIASYTVTPMGLLWLRDPTAGAARGWVELGAAVSQQAAAHPGAFLGATRYTYAAQLGFVLHNPDVAAFNPVRSQNDYWWDKAGHVGHDAILVADGSFRIDNARQDFATLEKLADVPVLDLFGQQVWTFEIWLGKDYGHGPG